MSKEELPYLSIFEVTNRTTGVKSYEAARSAQEACQQAGWLIGDCFVYRQKPEQRIYPRLGTISTVLIPCPTCPYQYGICNKPDAIDCPVRPEAPELEEWLKQASEAHLCPHQGDELTKKNHLLKLKRVTLTQAVKELAPYHLSTAENTP